MQLMGKTSSVQHASDTSWSLLATRTWHNGYEFDLGSLPELREAVMPPKTQNHIYQGYASPVEDGLWVEASLFHDLTP